MSDYQQILTTSLPINHQVTIAYIQERVKEVAADNGLDPEDAWSSLLQKAKEAPAALIETQQEY